MIHCPGCGEENPPKFRLCGYCGTPLAAAAPALPARELRKTVTIVFSDLKGSTALGEVLDPEALHEVKERYFSAMAAEITRHGGRIEKYIGDAIMAVFGLPRAHEDDALRAVRAAGGMREALERVNEALMARHGVRLANRTGVNTGEVVASDDPTADQKLATGDAVNIAARLEQAAPENEVYLGETTYRLVRDAVDVEPVEPLAVKGKAQRVPAFRLVAARGLDGVVRRHDRPMVGREAELETAERIYREVTEGPGVRLVTVVGDAGVGKSRLVHEVIDRVAGDARVYRGRCLPYGDGITFWPLMTILREAAGVAEEAPGDVALGALQAACGDPEVADRLASAIGWLSKPFALQDIQWAARKFFERLAADGPVVIFIDDIHWAETAFLDLLDHVLQTAGRLPILILATARHELLEERGDWGTQPGATRIVLRPLEDAAAAEVVAQLLGTAGLPAGVLQEIVRAAGGNPLYAEQMLSMLIDSGALRLEEGQWVRTAHAAEITVPPTIQALLEARLDRLARHERATIEPASVIGLEFPQLAIEALVPQAVRAALSDHLSALTRKQLIRPAPAAGAEAHHRFHHHLVRDAVYNGLLKRARAHLHLELVRWTDRAQPDRALELAEVLGYHLEQAYRYFGELGPLDAQGQAIGEDAARRLGSAGRRAAARGDNHAAVNLLRRAAGLLPAAHGDRLALLPDLADALKDLGDFAGARAVVEEAIELGERVGDPRVQASAHVTAKLLQLYGGEQGGDWSREALAVAERFIPALERVDAHAELAAAWRLVVMVHGIAGRYGASSDAVLRSTEHARRAGNAWLEARNAYMQAQNDLQGPTTVPLAIRRCEALMAGGLGDRQIEGLIGCALAQLRAMNGEFEAARALCRSSRSMLRDLGQGVLAASTGADLARTELRAGDLEGAEREIRADYAFLAAKGESYLLSALAALLARIVRELGRDAEAFELTLAAEKATAEDDLESAALWRMVRAPLLARQGHAADAEALAGEALALARRMESPVLQADALAEMALVLRTNGRGEESHRTADEAIALYTAKGDVTSAGRWSRWREDTTAAARSAATDRPGPEAYLIR